jgi:hypothetical protein
VQGGYHTYVIPAGTLPPAAAMGGRASSPKCPQILRSDGNSRPRSVAGSRKLLFVDCEVMLLQTPYGAA